MTWLAMVLVGAGSYLLRVVPLLVLPRLTLSPSADRLLRHAGAAALGALVATSVAARSGDVTLVPTLAAVAVALALAVAGWPMIRVVAGGAAVYVAIALLASVLT